MKRNIDIDLKADIWNLLEELQRHSLKQVYENQEFYLDVLKFLFNKQFRQKTKTLREHLEVPLHWYNYPQNKEPHYKDLFELKEKHPDAPQREFDDVIVDLCSIVGLNPLRYGWFVLYYLYYGKISIGRDRAESLVAEKEFKRKARIIVKRNNYSSKDKSFDKPHQIIGYIQIFKDTTPEGLAEFVKDNMTTISKLQKKLTSYPVERVRGEEKFKRDIEIFLLNQLGLGDNQIANIMQNLPKKKEKDFLQQSFESFSQGNNPFTNRSKEDVYGDIAGGTVRAIISSIKQAISMRDSKSVKEIPR